MYTTFNYYTVIAGERNKTYYINNHSGCKLVHARFKNTYEHFSVKNKFLTVKILGNITL